MDLERLAELAGEADAPMVVDNTTATAVLQQPLELRASASLYSLTKATSGHADLLLGAVVSRDGTLLERLRAWRSSGGGIPGPFEAWLAHRGLQTLRTGGAAIGDGAGRRAPPRRPSRGNCRPLPGARGGDAGCGATADARGFGPCSP